MEAGSPAAKMNLPGAAVRLLRMRGVAGVGVPAISGGCSKALSGQLEAALCFLVGGLAEGWGCHLRFRLTARFTREADLCAPEHRLFGPL